jgi:DNA primase
MRVVIEHGNELLENGKKVYAWVFEEIDSFPFENVEMIHLLEAYKKWQEEGKNPNGKTLQYHEDPRIQQWVVELFAPEHELSQRWNEKLGITKKVEEKNFLTEVEISLMYFKLRKVKKMMEQNQRDLETAPESEQLHLLHIHKHLKQVERELTQSIGTVILK